VRADRLAGDPAAAHVILDVRPNGSVEFMTRFSTGGETRFLGTAMPGFPVWLQLSRSGGLISADISSDGSTWHHLGSVSSPPPSDALIGVAVTSHQRGSLVQAQFDSLSR